MKSFFKALGLAILSFFAFIGFGAVMVFVAFAILVSQVSSGRLSSSGVAPQVTIEKSYLEYTLDGPVATLAPRPADAILGELFGDPEVITLNQLQTSLRRAAEDIRVHGIYLRIKSMSSNLTTISSLRRSLLLLKAANKPVWAYLDSADNLSYYLASAADQVAIPSQGGAFIPGPVFNLTYFGPALGKLGAEMEVYRAGKYKSAMEPFLSDSPSEATLEMYQSMEKSLRSAFVGDIAASRGQSPEAVTSWFAESIFSSESAKEKGMIDAISYEPEFKQEFIAKVKAENSVGWQDYLAVSSELDEPMKGAEDKKIGYIVAAGTIVMDGDASDEIIEPDPIVKQLEWMAEQKDVSAVVLRIDSPGGSALASDIIWHAVKKLKAVKPVVVSMGSVAASGGYYMAAPASEIVAEAQTITGSIGVFAANLIGKNFADQYGLHFHVVTGSERSKLFNFGEAAGEEDQRILTQLMDETYRTFLQRVAEGRGRTTEEVHEIAQGRVYTGLEAKEIGLVDRIGDQRIAFNTAKELAGLDVNKLYSVARYRPKPKSIRDCLNQPENFFECTRELDAALKARLSSSPFGDWFKQVKIPLHLFKDRDVLAYWPHKLQF